MNSWYFFCEIDNIIGIKEETINKSIGNEFSSSTWIIEQSIYENKYV